LTSACDAIDYQKLRDVQLKAHAAGRLFGIGIAIGNHFRTDDAPCGLARMR
jgi:hypothetical protein